MLFKILGVLLCSSSVLGSFDLQDYFRLRFISAEEYLDVDQEITIPFNISYHVDGLRGNDLDILSWHVKFTADDKSVAKVTIGTPPPTVEELCDTSTKANASHQYENTISNITVKGLFLGATSIKAYLTPSSAKSGSFKSQLLDEMSLKVLRIPRNLELTLGYVILSLTILNNFWWGTQFDFTEVKQLLRRPSTIILALGLQFIFFPAWVFAVGSMFHQSDGILLASLVGAAPHCLAVMNFIVSEAHGNFNLSLLITIFSFILSFGSVPLWLHTLGTGLFHDIKVPFLAIAQNHGIFFGPFLVGILFRHFIPKCRMPISHILRLTSAAALVIAIVSVFVNSSYLLKFFNWSNVLNAVFTIHGTAAVTGFLAWSFGLKRPEIVALVIITSLKNINIVRPVLESIIKNPYVDLWMVPLHIAFNFAPLTILPYIVYRQFGIGIIKKCKGENSEGEKDTETVKEYLHGNGINSGVTSGGMADGKGKNGITTETAHRHANLDTILEGKDLEGYINDSFENSRL